MPIAIAGFEPPVRDRMQAGCSRLLLNCLRVRMDFLFVGRLGVRMRNLRPDIAVVVEPDKHLAVEASIAAHLSMVFVVRLSRT